MFCREIQAIATVSRNVALLTDFMNAALLPDANDAEIVEKLFVGNDCHLLLASLGNEHAVEGVAMCAAQCACDLRMCERNRKRCKALTKNLS